MRFKPEIKPVFVYLRRVDVNYNYWEIYKDVNLHGKIEDNMPINTPGKFSAWYPYLFPRMLWEVWNNDKVDLSSDRKVLKYFKIEEWIAREFSPQSLVILNRFIKVVYGKSLTKLGEAKV